MSSVIESAAIVAELRTTRKYGALAQGALARAADAALRTRPKRLADAVHYAREKLHQWSGAYRDPDLLRIERELATLDFESETAIREFAVRALSLHASTAERLESMSEIYRSLIAALPRFQCVVDLCGGANAFAWPFMALPAGVRYRAIDIDGRVANLANLWLAGLRCGGEATCGDVLTEDFEPAGDSQSIVWLFKAAPCLERQEDGATSRLLTRLRGAGCSHAVLSFPTRSLTGREKGMREHYDEWIRTTVEPQHPIAQKLEFKSEVFYVVALESKANGAPP